MPRKPVYTIPINKIIFKEIIKRKGYNIRSLTDKLSMLYVIIFRNFRRKPYKKDCKQLSICNPFYSKLLSKRIFLFCYYYVYRALANPKLLRGLTHSGFMFDDIICDFYCPLLNVIFHKNNPCINCFLQSMRGDFDVCLHFPFERRGSPAKKSHSPSPMAYYTFILYHIFSRNKFFTIYTWAF